VRISEFREFHVTVFMNSLTYYKCPSLCSVLNLFNTVNIFTSDVANEWLTRLFHILKAPGSILGFSQFIIHNHRTILRYVQLKRRFISQG